MVYYTGDIHGSASNIKRFAATYELKEDDIIVILGDVGANYYANIMDAVCKCELSSIPATIFCIHGNHERRPHTIPTYKLKDWHGGMVWCEDEYPNLLFARDGDVFDLDGVKHLVIGGAYSVDKYYRLERNLGWFPDEQPSEEIKAYVESQVQKQSFEIVLSHTCPFRYEPTEMFLGGIDQSAVDDSTERWLGEIESKIEYKAWLCGHWHTNKRIDKMHFLYHAFESLAEVLPERYYETI